MAPPTTAQAQKVVAQWDTIDKDALIEAMYKGMMTAHPEWRPLFKKPTGEPIPAEAEWKKQFDLTREAMDRALRACAVDMDALKQRMHTMAERHVDYGVTQTHFQALKPILTKVLTTTVTGADMDAWGAVTFFMLDSIV